MAQDTPTSNVLEHSRNAPIPAYPTTADGTGGTIRRAAFSQTYAEVAKIWKNILIKLLKNIENKITHIILIRSTAPAAPEARR